MLAHLCWIAWKLPIGLPNCSRTLAYSTLISSTRCAPPHISAQSATLARSTRRSSSAPARRRGAEHGVRADGDVVETDLAELARLVHGLEARRADARSPCASTQKRLTPSLPVGRGVRAGDDEEVGDVRVGHEELRAVEAVAAAVRLRRGQRDARRRPSAPRLELREGRAAASRRRSSAGSAASAPRCRPRASADRREDRGREERPRQDDAPISSSTTTRSTKSRPAPPYSSGRMRPSQPSSAIFCQSVGE